MTRWSRLISDEAIVFEEGRRAMSVRALLEREEGPTCSARTVDGFVRLGLAGVGWGLLAGSHDSLKEGYKGFPRALFVVKSAGKNSLLWGGFAGTYLGFNCGIERLRQKRDGINATVSGAISGALLAARTGSVSKIIASSVAASIGATVVHHLYPVNYPPTGF